MKITIDTKEDSPQEIQKAIDFLQAFHVSSKSILEDINPSSSMTIPTTALNFDLSSQLSSKEDLEIQFPSKAQPTLQESKQILRPVSSPLIGFNEILGSVKEKKQKVEDHSEIIPY